jgi:hypothetical protein
MYVPSTVLAAEHRLGRHRDLRHDHLASTSLSLKVSRDGVTDVLSPKGNP